MQTRTVRWSLRGVLPLAVGIGLSIACLKWMIQGHGPHDVDAYWQAAIRLRDGGQLYAATDPDSVLVYRYAPWFAWLWVPLTYLPQVAVFTLWRLVLLAAVVWIGFQPLNRWALALILPFLGLASWSGNVQPLLVAGLVYGLEHRSAPLWIALAASLKAAPALLALVYLARRQWWPFVTTAALTLVIVLPMLLYDLSGYNADPSMSLSLWFQVSPWAWLLVATAAAALVLWRPSWFTAGIAVITAMPRLILYDVSFLLPGARRSVDQRDVGKHADRGLLVDHPDDDL